MGQTEFSTALAQFNQNQLDTITTNVNNVQTSVNAIQNTNLANLANNVGSNADAASAAGSTHAKLKDLKSAVAAIAIVKSVQRGISSGTGPLDITISSVNPAKAIVNYPGSCTNVQWSLTNATTIHQSYSGALPSAPWEVIEYY
jgi:hypothetical protein